MSATPDATVTIPTAMFAEITGMAQGSARLLNALVQAEQALAAAGMFWQPPAVKRETAAALAAVREAMAAQPFDDVSAAIGRAS